MRTIERINQGSLSPAARGPYGACERPHGGTCTSRSNEVVKEKYPVKCESLYGDLCVHSQRTTRTTRQAQMMACK